MLKVCENDGCCNEVPRQNQRFCCHNCAMVSQHNVEARIKAGDEFFKKFPYETAGDCAAYMGLTLYQVRRMKKELVTRSRSEYKRQWGF